MRELRDTPLDRFAEVIVQMTPDELGRIFGVRAQTGKLALLTPKEREVYDLVVRHVSNAGVARQLGISLKTVQTHRVKINRKLGAHSTAHLVALAAREGLL